MTVTLNAYQSEQLAKFMSAYAEDQRVAVSYGQKAMPIDRLEWFLCKVPGMIAAVTKSGFVVKLIYPEPRPVPKDPLFQHAEKVRDSFHRRLMLMVRVQAGFYRDWQVESDCMDAPDHFPAGSCEAFCHDEDIYGASQTTWEREPY